MLKAKLRALPAVEKVQKQGNALFLYSQRGVLRLKPQNQRIVRHTYTQADVISEKSGIGILKQEEFSNWSWQENSKEVRLITNELVLCVNKATASISYWDKNNKLLLAERSFDSRELDEFDSYKIVVDENTMVKETVTPDGVKKEIKQAATVLDKKLYHTRLHLSWQEDEYIYGLGQSEQGMLNLRGTVQYLHQANMKIAIPFLVSTMGYGILLSTGGTAVFQDTQFGSYLYTQADEEMDYYFVGGENLDKIISGYRFLTGKAAMLPRWAFGFIQSQERYENQEELLEIGKEFRKRKIGVDAIVLDWCSWEDGKWGEKILDKKRFSDPAKTINSLHELGLHFMVSIWPNMAECTSNYAEFQSKGLLLPASEIYDAYNQGARKLYWKQAVDGFYKYGVDAWWCDSSEPFTPEWSRKNKPEPAQMYEEFVTQAGKYIPLEKLNAYGLFHAMAIYEGQRELKDGKRVANLTRSTYTGGQRYGTILWSGDISASWDTLKNQICAGLNFCASGLPFWTLDIGAFFVKKGEQWFWNGDYDKGTEDLGYKELFVRWYQYAAFLPVFRSHGTDFRREMWLFGEENNDFYSAMLKANKLRYSLMPYIYSWAFKVWREDKTLMRLLAFDFKEDKEALKVTDEYMFGDSILVCPVTTPMYYEVNSQKLECIEKTRQVYLPAGCKWYDFYTDKIYEGGQLIKANADLEKMPLYIKAGSIIPRMEGLQHTGEMEGKQVVWHVYPGANCEFTLYEDSGDGYEYENGQHKLTSVRWIEEKMQLEGEFKGEIIIH